MKNSLKFAILILIIVAICVGLIIFFATTFPSRTTESTTNIDNTNFSVDTSKTLINYESELLDVNFSKYVVESYGKIESEDYAKVKFKINSNLVDELKNELGSKMSINNSILSPEYSEMKLAKEVRANAKNMTSIISYSVFKSGKVAKTREFYLFLFQDNNDFYLFIYG